VIRRLAQKIRNAGRRIGRLSQVSQRLRSHARLWRVARHEKKCPTATDSRVGSIATGFAWRADNIGGVRRHLECLQEYSKFPVSIYPSTLGSTLLSPLEKESYHKGLSYHQLRHHDLFHSHVDPRFIDICQTAQCHGKPWVHTYHAMYFKEDWGGTLLDWQIEINNSLTQRARQANVLISVSPWLATYLKDEHQIRSITIPNAVNVEACDEAVASIDVKASASPSSVLFVGSAESVKNPKAFILAATALPKFEFTMIGSNLTPSNWEKYFPDVAIPANVELLGARSHAECLAAIAACRVFVMTSHREGFPTVLLEAMAMGKPCVAPNSFGCRDAISDEPGCGFLFEPDNLEHLVNQICLAAEHAYMPMANERVQREFSWRVVADKIDRVYADLLRIA
jgi:glycosyltransferase involved in cell wall biosynthesis